MPRRFKPIKPTKVCMSSKSLGALARRYETLTLLDKWNVGVLRSHASDFCVSEVPIKWENRAEKVSRACVMLGDDCHDVIVKRLGVSADDLKTVTSRLSALEGGAGNVDFVLETLLTIPSICEAYVGLICTELVRWQVCPNFIWTVNWGLCKDHTDNSTGIVTVSEVAELGDLKSWCGKSNWSYAVWKSALFQIFAGIWTMQKYFDLTHRDLHWGNVFVQEIEEGGVFHYIIEGVDYYVPNFGFLFMIGDFGNVHVPHKIVNFTYTGQQEEKRYVADYYRITHSIVWSADAYWGGKVDSAVGGLFTRVREMFNLGVTLDAVIPALFTDYTTVSRKFGKVQGTFDMDSSPSFLKDEFKYLLRNEWKGSFGGDGPMWLSL